MGVQGLEVLLVHPRGATFKRPLFGIPKGAIEEGETPQEAAARETFEETGVSVDVHMELGHIEQRSGKIVHAFWATVRATCTTAIDADGRCVSHDLENDVCRFYLLEKAVSMMLPAQRELLGRLPNDNSMLLNPGAGASTERREEELSMPDVRIKVLKDGPYEIKGAVDIVDAKRNSFKLEEDPVYLCRCGQSKNKPFCDGSHTQLGFKSDDLVK